jgi:hypothetical protein
VDALNEHVLDKHMLPGLRYYQDLGSIVVMFARAARDEQDDKAERAALYREHANKPTWYEAEAVYTKRTEARRARDPLHNGRATDAQVAVRAFFGLPCCRTTFSALQDPLNPAAKMPTYDAPEAMVRQPAVE